MKSKSLQIFPLLIIFIISFLLTSCKMNSEDTVPHFFSKRYEGTINNENQRIVVNLNRIDTALSGNYYYINQGKLINFSYTSKIDSNGDIFLGEVTGKYDKNYNPIYSGIFNGKFRSNKQIEGTWEKPGTNKKYSFILDESYPEGSASFDLIHEEENYKKLKDGFGAQIKLSYPNISDSPNQSAADSINYALSNLYLTSYNLESKGKKWNSLKEICDDFISGYKHFIETDTLYPKDYQPRWSIDFSTDVLFNSDDIVSYKTTMYRFEGGAHPNTFYTLNSYNLKTGKRIKLSEILTGEYQEELNKLGEQKLREYYNVKPNETLQQAGFFLDHNKFIMNHNYVIAPAGLIFQINAYEIAPYVMGAPQLFIPFKEIKNIVKKDCIISNLTEKYGEQQASY